MSAAEEETSATLQSAQLSQQTVERRGALLKCSMPALIHLRGVLEEGRVKRRRMPAWSNWWVYVAVKVRLAERNFGKGFLERDL
jgi:hypothetical protein